MKGRFPPLNEDQRRELELEYSYDEVWRALKGVGPLKAPAPDGFPTAFFQRTLGTTCHTLVHFVKQALEQR